MVISRLVSLCNLLFPLKNLLVSTPPRSFNYHVTFHSFHVPWSRLRLLSFSKIANEVVINILGLLPGRWARVSLEWLLRIGAAELQMVRVSNVIVPTQVYQFAQPCELDDL